MRIKQKNSILVISSLLLMFGCYHLAIKKTFLQKKIYKELKEQESLFTALPEQFRVLKQKEKYYDSLLNRFQITETSLQNSLLKTINKASHQLNVKVIDFNEPHIFGVDDIQCNSYTFTIEGGFENVLKLIYQLEQQTKFGEVVNVNMLKDKRPRSRKEFLQAEVMIMNYN